MKPTPQPLNPIDHTELAKYAGTFARIEWLLLVLLLLYIVTPNVRVTSTPVVVLAACGYFAAVLSLHLFGARREHRPWVIALRTWLMIALIAWVMWHSGGVHSPLLGLFLLPLVAAALILGMGMTLFDTLLVTLIYLSLGWFEDPQGKLPPQELARLAVVFSPFLLVAYLTASLHRDIAQASQRIQTLSLTDELTGLYNLRAFKNLMAREETRAKRYQRSFTILMIDADFLKQINDQYGHSAGSELIRHVARHIRRSLRTTDIPARYGGDEFVALLVETPSQGGWAVAERLRQAVAQNPIMLEKENITASVSIGLAAYPEHGENAEAVLALADQALYESKRAGRNLVRVHSR